MERLSIIRKSWIHNGIVLAVGIAGGAIFSLTGMPLAWMLGTLTATLLLAIRSRQSWSFSPLWRWLAQLGIAVHLGQQMNSKLFANVFGELGYIAAGIVLLLGSSIAAGLAVKSLTNVHPATALFGTVPGGATEMAVIAEELGGSPVLVALLQSIRMISVIVLVPMAAWSLGIPATALDPPASAAGIDGYALLSTALLIGLAVAGWKLGKKLRLMTPALTGGVLLVSAAQLAASWSFGEPLQPFWPADTMIAAQVLLGCSIGIAFRPAHAKGGVRYLLIGATGNLLTLVIAMLSVAAYASIAARDTVTAMLAFAPGGVSEMAIAATQFHADSPFVATVQLIRMLVVMSVAPIIVRWLVLHVQKRESRRPAASDKGIRTQMEESES